MAETKHTPGPWAFDPDDFSEVYSEDSAAMVCKVLDADDFPCLEEGTHSDVQDECLANAHLIAAAPEILEALRPFAEAADGFDGPNGKNGVPDSFHILKGLTVGDLRAARAAIAKAEGRS